MNKSLAVALVIVLAVSVYLLTQDKPINHFYQETSFYLEFGIVPTSNFSYPFSPPISMYCALQIGLRNEGWNRISLIGKSVTVDFVYAYTGGDAARGPVSGVEDTVASPPRSYLAVDVPLGITLEYAWAITVNNAKSSSNSTLGFSLVDAQNGALLPNAHAPTQPTNVLNK